MKPTKKPRPTKMFAGAHKKATYTLPPDVLSAVDENWRFHETLDASLADSKSEYVADLIRRDAASKKAAPKTTKHP
uniref:Uncharacterized protein n=1 Tax=mine drainage metagenome TaxID=410659 RepID=E6PHU0_9ZZZZ